MSHSQRPDPSPSKRPDQVGAWASALCLVHCAVPPIFFAAASAWQSTWGWESIDLFFLIVSFLAVWYANKGVEKRRTRIVLWLGWSLLATGIGLEQGGWHSGKFLLYAGSAALVIGHLWNLRTRKKSCPVHLAGPGYSSKRA